jgi:hypothetical protein
VALRPRLSPGVPLSMVWERSQPAIKQGGDLPWHLPSGMTPRLDTMSSPELPHGGKYPCYCRRETQRQLLVPWLNTRSSSSTHSPGPSLWPMKLAGRYTRRLRSASA